MVSKVQERIFAETAITLLGTDWRLADIPEPLDFEVQCAGETFGLEVRQLFASGETVYGSPSKRSESKNQKVIRALAKRYYQLGGVAISAKFLGALAVEDVECISQSMVGHAPKHPGASNTLTVRRVKIFMSPVPASFGHYSRWLAVDDRVGWAREVNAADIQSAIDKKADNLALYKEKYPDIDLLLVADRTFNSGRLLPVKHLKVRNPGFRHIYFLSYPEAIQRVG